MYKSVCVDLCVKGSNLARFLSEEKNERLISEKLFSSICELAKCCYNLDNPSLSKADFAAFRKNALCEHGSILMYLETLYITGYISSAQKDSMTSTLNNLKKQANI